MTEAVLTKRHASLEDLAAVLRQQHADKWDVVVPASGLRADGGQFRITAGGQPVLSSSGVTTPEGVFAPTEVFDGGVAEKLRIPVHYVRRLRQQHLALYDANVNTWLADEPARRFLVRTLRSADGSGVARALLSERYRVVDNLDVLFAVLSGIRSCGARVRVASGDLSERNMYVKVHCPGIEVLAPALLRNYRSPFTGQRGDECPVVFAGFVVSNSETGHGSFSITPQITVKVCDNGVTFSQDTLRHVHLGPSLDEGMVRWSSATKQKALELVTAQAHDAVTTFLDQSYVERKIAEIERDAVVPVSQPQSTVEYVSKQLRFTEQQQNTILAHFVDAGDRSCGGVLHAVTSAAQTVTDVDEAYALERHGVRAMRLAAEHQR